MARTNIPVQVVSLAGTTIETSVAADVANGHVIDLSGVKSGRVLVRINSTFAGAKTFTFKAGVNPPAFRAALGDFVVTLNAQVGLVVLETARVQGQASPDQTKVYLDLAAATTGTISVYAIPDGV